MFWKQLFMKWEFKYQVLHPIYRVKAKDYLLQDDEDSKDDIILKDSKDRDDRRDSKDGKKKDDKKDRERREKKEKKKMVTVDPYLLLSFVYFDQTHTGYIIDRDLEDIINMLGLNLSRAQVGWSPLHIWSNTFTWN